MYAFYLVLMFAGGGILSYGFYLASVGRGTRAWTGIALLFAGLAAAFLGALLALAPGFFG